MAKYQIQYEGKDGWSGWVSPTLVSPYYRMMCCDCGLVHELKFKFFTNVRYAGNGFWSGKLAKGVKVMFKARRNNRSTALARRARKTKIGFRQYGKTQGITEAWRAPEGHA